MSLQGTDLALVSARIGVARIGASRLGFVPDDVEGAGTVGPGEYGWQEVKPEDDGQDWDLMTPWSMCATPPVASFSAAPNPVAPGAAVAFTDTSTPTGEITFWHWTFGDGAESDQQNPSHVYAHAGTYAVRLYIASPRGSSMAVGSMVVAIPAVPAADCAVGWPAATPRLIGSHYNSVAFYAAALTSRSLDLAALGFGISSVWGDGVNLPYLTGNGAAGCYLYVLDGTTTPVLVASQSPGTDSNRVFHDVVKFGGNLYLSRFRILAGFGNAIGDVQVWDGAAFTTENEMIWGAWVGGNNLRCPVLALFNSDLYCSWTVETLLGTGANKIQRRNGGTWDDLAMPGANWRARCSAVFGADLYFGGGEIAAGVDSGGEILKVTPGDVVSVVRTVGDEKIVSLAVHDGALYYLYYDSGAGFYRMGKYDGGWNDTFKAFDEGGFGLFSVISEDARLMSFGGSLYIVASPSGLVKGPANLALAWSLVDSCGDCGAGSYCFLPVSSLHDRSLAVMA